jgi:hypothetical protein
MWEGTHYSCCKVFEQILETEEIVRVIPPDTKFEELLNMNLKPIEAARVRYIMNNPDFYRDSYE